LQQAKSQPRLHTDIPRGWHYAVPKTRLRRSAFKKFLYSSFRRVVFILKGSLNTKEWFRTGLPFRRGPFFLAIIL
jgi:hypothetical protein